MSDLRVPTGYLQKAIIKQKTKCLEVHFVPPFSVEGTSLAVDSRESQFERTLDLAREAITKFNVINEVLQPVCSESGVTLNYQVRIDYIVREEHVRAALSALIEYYAQSEGVAAGWLNTAEFTLLSQNDLDASVASLFIVRYAFRLEMERVSLMRKGTATWISQMAGSVFGIDLECEFSVDESASEKHELLRREVERVEQRNVHVMVEREEERARQERDHPKEQEKSSFNQGNGSSHWRNKSDDEPSAPLTLGRSINSPLTKLVEIVDEMRRVAVQGRVFSADTRTLPSGRTLVQFNITDDTSSISAKLFCNSDKQLEALKSLEDGVHLRIQGQVQFDTFAKELVFMVQDMMPIEAPKRLDEAEQKRVELHLHTTMSALDGVTTFEKYVKQAAKWGHKAIALTDHGVVQEFPHAYDLGQKHGVKVLLGVEAYVVDDGSPIAYRVQDVRLDDNLSYVVFDTETTGLNAREDTLIEIAAVKVQGGKVIDTFSTLIDPERGVSAKITEITGINSDMLIGQPKLEKALNDFRSYADGCVLVAHNAEFDVGFLSQCALRIGMDVWTQPVIDTLSLARALYPGEKNYRLKTLTQKFGVVLINHHRALADAEATSEVFQKMLNDVHHSGIHNLTDLNKLSGQLDVSRVRPFHLTILVQNQMGLRNLYELISLSHTKYLYRQPRMPRSELIRLREGLLFGTACQNGELIQAFLRGKTIEEIEELSKFYDYLEIQPLSHYDNLLRDEILHSMQSMRTIHQQIVEIGKNLDKPVVATGDVHFLNSEDAIYREIFLQSQHGVDASKQPPLYLRTTQEMLEEFSYLGADAVDVVVASPAAIAASLDDVKPLPDKLFTPVIDGAEDEIRNLSYNKAKSLYGEKLPHIVEARLQKELNSIINNGFAVIYLISHKLVTKSLADGYLVGSRGSVGSSLVATMTDITEVNPLVPHYRCPSCLYSEFLEDGSYGSGFDLPPKDCPVCQTALIKDGQDIPFETFLGFEGDKVPDIDLNFSGEYQPRAHKYTEELFGRDHVFRAGTISAVADKTAYGYVRKFADERGMMLRNAEIDRLVKGCTGVKRTTGQHPGGQVVVPADVSIYDFTPVQHPADDKEGGTLTTHFDYHSGLENCLLKLDILGHDDPTVIRMLQDLTGVDPKSIPLDDKLVLDLFSGTSSLNVKPEDIRSNKGTYAIPEFGTKFVRQMLEDTRPTTFSDLVRISGLSHGTDVWLNNAQELIRNQTATLSEVICTRDDIMVYLIYKGLEPGRAFKIMESIRKGRGVKDDDADYMREFNVPVWYIESGRKIKYMFPKAHAAAYVLMAVRIAWFKVHHPLAFYATYFSVRADDFDVDVMITGKQAITQKIEEIEQKGNAAPPKEKGLLTVLEVALEMSARGFKFLPIDLYKSHATKFQVLDDEKALLPPFAAIVGVGAAAASNLSSAAREGKYLSIEDLQSRSRVSKSVIEVLQGFGCLAGLPDSNQLSLF